MGNAKLSAIVGLLVLLVSVHGCSPAAVNNSSAGTSAITPGGGSSNLVLPLAMLITTTPATISTGATSQIKVHVVDGLGNPVPDGTSVNFSLDNGLKGILSSSSQVTTGGDVTVTFTAGTLSSVAVVTASIGSSKVNATVSILGNTPGSVVVSAATTSLSAGNTTVITAKVLDSLSQPVSNATVSFTTDPTKASLSTTTAKTDANGVATVVLTAAAGPYATVDASCLSATDTVSINISGSTASGSIAVSSTLTSIVTGGSATITLLLRDAGGQPISGATVDLGLSNSAAGTLGSTSAITNNAGVASVGFTAGGLPTSAIVSASYATLGFTSSVNLTITAPPPADIVITASPAAIPVRGTSTITAVVTDTTGSAVLDGTQVSFVLNDSSYGALSNVFATTSGGAGTTTITFTAGLKAGAVTISAIAGNVTKTVTITISAAPTGSIQFISASPQVIGIKGSGQSETSTVTFGVVDINGDPVVDGTRVDFLLQGPGGGEYIGLTPGTTTASGSTVSGNATVILRSGTVAGPVTIIATTTIAGGGTISTSAGQISIGGGVPSAAHFDLTTSQLNLPGLAIINKTANISAYVADRFGNYNVLEGTSISFYTEAGAIDRSASTVAGSASVNFRTQDPMPASVAKTVAEGTDISALNSKYSATIPEDGSVHPRNGRATILATVQGEESFIDENGNGLFNNSYSTSTCPLGYACECVGGASIKPADAGRTCPANRSEAFIDMGEPFIDVNDDDCWNSTSKAYCSYDTVGVASSDPFETYIDANKNGKYDGPNGIWDGPACQTANCQPSKMIWTTAKLALTGNAQYCFASPYTAPPGGVQIHYGQSEDFSLMVGDINTNSVSPGTTIDVENETTNCPDLLTCVPNGTLTGQGTTGNTGSSGIYTVMDKLPDGPVEITFNMKADDPKASPYCSCTGTPVVCTCQPSSTSIVIRVESKDIIGCSLTIPVNFVP